MANRRVLRIEDVKLNNRNKILAMIYNSGKVGISQSALVNESGLKGASIFRIFTELEKDKLIKFVEEPKEITILKGRKPTYYTVDPDALYTIGVEISYNKVEISIFNFLLDVLASATYDIVNEDINDIVNIITDYVNTEIDAIGLPKNKIIGMGVAIPGVVDLYTGEILKYERIKGCIEFPLAEELKKRLGFVVTVTNSTATHAYYDYHTHQYGDSVFTILLRNGINGAFINKGKVFLDSNGYSLDFEHLQISFAGGPECSCGNQGCLQSYLFNIEDEYNDQILLDLEKYLSTDLTRLDFILDKIVFYISVLLKGFDKIVNPSCFLILTKDKKIGEILRNKLRKAMEERVSSYSKDLQKPIYSSTYNTLHVQKGAVEILLKKFFDPELVIWK